jgi:hypothetical protein
VQSTSGSARSDGSSRFDGCVWAGAAGNLLIPKGKPRSASGLGEFF